jgi:hypothetical protein
MFAPEGAVRVVRQATARFSAPMVPFGDLRAPAPFEVDCPVAGTGRWVDDRTWAYDFARDLPGAVRCRFTLRPDTRDIKGQPLAGQREFAVATGGPAVLRAGRMTATRASTSARSLCWCCRRRRRRCLSAPTPGARPRAWRTG